MALSYRGSSPRGAVSAGECDVLHSLSGRPSPIKLPELLLLSASVGILVVYDFALVFALAPISPMFCPKFLPLPLPSILPI